MSDVTVISIGDYPHSVVLSTNEQLVKIGLEAAKRHCEKLGWVVDDPAGPRPRPARPGASFPTIAYVNARTVHLVDLEAAQAETSRHEARKWCAEWLLGRARELEGPGIKRGLDLEGKAAVDGQVAALQQASDAIKRVKP